MRTITTAAITPLPMPGLSLTNETSKNPAQASEFVI
jgi:hypothetical protein